MKEKLILKRASAGRPSGEWNDDDYDVRADDKEQYHYLRLATGGGL